MIVYRFMKAVFALVVALVIFGGACTCEDRGSPEDLAAPPDTCRQGAADPDRAARVRQLLGRTDGGALLLSGVGEGRQICFVEGRETAIDTEGTLLLDRLHSDGRSAARMGHLLLHAREGLFDFSRDDGRPCAQVVAEALEQEVRAHCLEMELRAALGVTEAPFPFEGAFWAAPAPERAAVVRRYFREHPDGGGGLPGLVTAYTRRCEQGRRQSGTVPSS